MKNLAPLRACGGYQEVVCLLSAEKHSFPFGLIGRRKEKGGREEKGREGKELKMRSSSAWMTVALASGELVDEVATTLSRL